MPKKPSPKAILGEINQIAEQPGKRFYRLALLLHDLQQADPALFKKSTTSGPIGRRRAYDLVLVARTFRKMGIDPERLERVGWAKLKVIAKKVSDPVTAISYLDLAERATVHVLESQIEAGQDPKSTRVVMLYLSPDQYALYKTAVIEFGAKPRGKGLVGQEKALIALLTNIDGS